MSTNLKEPINFSSKYLKAFWLKNANDYYIKNRTIVVNLGEQKAYIGALPEKYLLPRASTILKEVSLKSGDSLLLIEYMIPLTLVVLSWMRNGIN